MLVLFRKLEEKQAKLERQLEVERKKLDEEQRKLDDERKALEVERTRVAQEVSFQHLFHEIILLSLKKTSINIFIEFVSIVCKASILHVNSIQYYTCQQL